MLLSKEDSAIIKEMLGIEADIINIFWIYRSKKFYDISNEVIKSYHVRINGKLSKKTTASLMNAADSEEYLDILKKTPYGFLFDDQNQLFFEHNYLEYIYKIHKCTSEDSRFLLHV